MRHTRRGLFRRLIAAPLAAAAGVTIARKPKSSRNVVGRALAHLDRSRSAIARAINAKYRQIRNRDGVHISTSWTPWHDETPPWGGQE